MKKMFLILTMCLFFNQNVYSETLDMAKNYSYQASVQYINRNFDDASSLYKKSLDIRKKLNFKNEHYVTVLKLYIYAQWRTDNFCNINIDSGDYLLLINNNDKEFLYDFNFMNSGCEKL
jgi:hypothetical protein